MSAYGCTVAAHVALAIFGVGPLAGVSLVRREAKGRLLRNARVALAGLFLSGAALDLVAGGAWHEATWFRASALLLAVTGGLSALAGRALRRGVEASADRLAWAMCATVALITALMELKPQ